jgi:hypothetical protein
VWFLDVGTPVTTTNGDDGEFGGDDGTSDSGGYFLGALDTETDVSVKVTDGDERLESGSLTGRGLLLYGSDVHDLVGCKVKKERETRYEVSHFTPHLSPGPKLTSSFKVGKNLSTIWYSLMGREKR